MLTAALARDFGRLLELDGVDGGDSIVWLVEEFVLEMVLVLVMRFSGRFLSGYEVTATGFVETELLLVVVVVALRSMVSVRLFKKFSAETMETEVLDVGQLSGSE